MTSAKFKQWCLRSMIGFLSLTAAVSIFSLLSDEFGRTQMKMFLSALTIAAASFCGMASAGSMGKRGKVYLGGAGAVSAGVTAALLLWAIWNRVDNKFFWKTTGSMFCLSWALTHGLLFFIPTLEPRHRWSQKSGTALAGVLAIQLIVAMWGEIEAKDYYRFVGVSTVLLMLFSLVVPILASLRRSKTAVTPALTLSSEENDIYRDAAGERYRVTKM